MTLEHLSATTAPLNVNTNPYDPPSATDETIPQRDRILCVTMFWLSAVFATFASISAILVAVQNYLAMAEMGGSLPTYIPLLVVLVACCAFGFGWSSLKWRSRKIRPAIISFVSSVFALFAGPYILLMLLYGLPN
jgi:hypothetical protein